MNERDRMFLRETHEKRANEQRLKEQKNQQEQAQLAELETLETKLKQLTNTLDTLQVLDSKLQRVIYLITNTFKKFHEFYTSRRYVEDIEKLIEEVYALAFETKLEKLEGHVSTLNEIKTLLNTLLEEFSQGAGYLSQHVVPQIYDQLKKLDLNKNIMLIKKMKQTTENKITKLKEISDEIVPATFQLQAANLLDTSDSQPLTDVNSQEEDPRVTKLTIFINRLNKIYSAFKSVQTNTEPLSSEELSLFKEDILALANELFSDSDILEEKLEIQLKEQLEKSMTALDKFITPPHERKELEKAALYFWNMKNSVETHVEVITHKRPKLLSESNVELSRIGPLAVLTLALTSQLKECDSFTSFNRLLSYTLASIPSEILFGNTSYLSREGATSLYINLLKKEPLEKQQSTLVETINRRSLFRLAAILQDPLFPLDSLYIEHINGQSNDNFSIKNLGSNNSRDPSNITIWNADKNLQILSPLAWLIQNEWVSGLDYWLKHITNIKITDPIVTFYETNGINTFKLSTLTIFDFAMKNQKFAIIKYLLRNGHHHFFNLDAAKQLYAAGQFDLFIRTLELNGNIPDKKNFIPFALGINKELIILGLEKNDEALLSFLLPCYDTNSMTVAFNKLLYDLRSNIKLSVAQIRDYSHNLFMYYLSAFKKIGASEAFLNLVTNTNFFPDGNSDKKISACLLMASELPNKQYLVLIFKKMSHEKSFSSKEIFEAWKDKIWPVILNQNPISSFFLDTIEYILPLTSQIDNFFKLLSEVDEEKYKEILNKINVHSLLENPHLIEYALNLDEKFNIENTSPTAHEKIFFDHVKKVLTENKQADISDWQHNNNFMHKAIYLRLPRTCEFFASNPSLLSESNRYGKTPLSYLSDPKNRAFWREQVRKDRNKTYAKLLAPELRLNLKKIYLFDNEKYPLAQKALSLNDISSNYWEVKNLHGEESHSGAEPNDMVVAYCTNLADLEKFLMAIDLNPKTIPVLFVSPELQELLNNKTDRQYKKFCYKRAILGPLVMPPSDYQNNFYQLQNKLSEVLSLIGKDSKKSAYLLLDKYIENRWNQSDSMLIGISFFREQAEFSKLEDISAAIQLKTVLMGLDDPISLLPHLKTLQKGDLSRICTLNRELTETINSAINPQSNQYEF